jgi:hypothetical protein
MIALTEPLVYVSFITGFEQQQPIFIIVEKIFHTLSKVNNRFCSSILDFNRPMDVFFDVHHLQKAPVPLQIITAVFSYICPHLQRNCMRVFCIIVPYVPIIVAPSRINAISIFMFLSHTPFYNQSAKIYYIKFLNQAIL